MPQLPLAELLPAVLGSVFYILYTLLLAGRRHRASARGSKSVDAVEEPACPKLCSSLPKPEQLCSDDEPEPASAACPSPATSEGEPEPSPEPEEEAAGPTPWTGPPSGGGPRKRAARRREAAPSHRGLIAAAAAAAGAFALAVWQHQRSAGGPRPAPLHALLREPSEAVVPSVAQMLAKMRDEQPQEVVREEDTVVTLGLTRQEMAVHNVGELAYYKSAYWGTLSVGTPPVPFRVVFDTGSGHLILPSTYCHSETCRAHKRYRRSASSTAKDIDYDGSAVQPGEPRDQITVSFGTGEVTGVFVEDIVCVEDGAMPALPWGVGSAAAASRSPTVHKAAEPQGDGGLPPRGCVRMRVIVATEMSEEPFKDFQFDGVLGLGLGGLSQAPEFNFPGVVSGLVQQLGGPSPHTFAVFLAEHPGETSEITFGGWSKRRLDGPLSWTPVLEPALGHWLVRIKSMRVDGELVKFCEDGTCRAVVDTGTSLLAVPSSAFPEVYDLLKHPARLDGHCQGGGPELQIELEGDDLTLRLGPEDYARSERSWVPAGSRARWPCTDATSSLCGSQAQARKDLYCKPMLMSMDLPAPIGPKLFILGEPVLRRYYSVYDARQERIGFAPARHSLQPAAATVDHDSDEWWWEEEEEEEE